jgi:hypothetical protein
VMALSNDLIASLVFVIESIGVLSFVIIVFVFLDLFIRGLTFYEKE